MSTSSMLLVGSIEALVVRKAIKNLHLSVLPPNGKVRVTAPSGMKDDAVRTLLATRLSWIRKQQARFAGQERQTRRDYISGESHYYFGKRYRLEVAFKEQPPSIQLKGKNKILLSVRPATSRYRREEIMLEWYRRELRAILDEIMVNWQKRIGVQAVKWGIQRMKTRWGTCNNKSGRILFNLELAKKPLPCIEYVVVHELLHLIEKKHNERFTDLMSKYLIKWKSLREELNRLMLSYEEWSY